MRNLISLNDLSVRERERERERFSLGSVSGLKSAGRDRLGYETTGIFFSSFFLMSEVFQRLETQVSLFSSTHGCLAAVKFLD